MKKMILVLALVMLVLTGCSGSKTEKPTAATEPPQTTAETKAEYGAVITAPTEATVPVTTAPAVTETAPPATTAPAPAAIIITKNPSSETVSAGGRTWFITSAENETQITWEIFSPDGTMYSLQQAMSAHPGLILEVLPEDTLGLRQIPVTFSGWSARARYDGPGGTATTNRATITVLEATKPQTTTNAGNPYANIIETYRTVHRTGTGNIEKGISELVNDYDYVGYAEVDLDGNGIKELILASDGNNIYPFVIYEIYTLRNGNPILVTSSRARERYFMLTDGRFLMEGSSGAMYGHWITYDFSGESLSVQEQIWTNEEPHDLADFAPYYYYSSGGYGVIQPMVYDEAARTIETWEWRITLPILTPIN